jgi:septum formation protein
VGAVSIPSSLPVRLVLASASPARLATLRAAGIEPVVEVSGIDESAVFEPTPGALAATLARLKGEDVTARLSPRHSVGEGPRTLVLGCDSGLDVDGEAFGKPEDPAIAADRLRRLRGRAAQLRTGHHLTDLGSGETREAVATTLVVFGEFTDAEIDAYVATGEPLRVAGAFTIDGIGGAFVERVDGDPSNVVGLSLPLLRRMVADLGVAWYALWKWPEGTTK